MSIQQARLTMNFLRMNIWKKRLIFSVITSHFNIFKPTRRAQYLHCTSRTNGLTSPLDWRSAVHWHSSHSPFGSNIIYNARPPPKLRTITNNGFKNCRLALQITISLSSVHCPCSHTTWETSQEVAHHKISP